MKKWTLFFYLIIATTTSYGIQLHNFAEIKSAVATGQSIKILLYPDKCKGMYARDNNRFFMFFADKAKLNNAKLDSDYFIEYTPDMFYGSQFKIMASSTTFVNEPQQR